VVEHRSDERNEFFRAAAFHSKPYHRRFDEAPNGDEGMEIRVHSYDDRIVGGRFGQDSLIRCALHTERRNVICLKSENRQEFCRVRWNTLIQEQLHSEHLSNCGSDVLVSDACSSEFQRLPHIVLFEIRVIPKQLIPIRVGRNSSNHAPDGEPHAADTRLPVHLFWIYCNSIKHGNRHNPLSYEF
jgi:hypothetical protein